NPRHSMDESNDIQKELTKYVEDAQRRNMKLILMGDFNLNFEHYNNKYNTTGKFRREYFILHKLVTCDLIDTMDLYHDITPSTPFNTFISKQQTSNPSRIDMIWIS